MPTLTLNGESRQVDATRVDQLVQTLGLAGQAVAVEINHHLIRKRDHADTPLRDGDTVELVTLVGGG